MNEYNIHDYIMDIERIDVSHLKQQSCNLTQGASFGSFYCPTSLPPPLIHSVKVRLEMGYKHKYMKILQVRNYQFLVDWTIIFYAS